VLVLCMTGCAVAAFIPPAYFAGISTTRHMAGANLATALALTITIGLAVSMTWQALPRPRPRPGTGRHGGDSLAPSGSAAQMPRPAIWFVRA
jgi:hypothetical protein